MIVIQSHENGPAGSGHGGISSGRFAELVDCRAARVRLHRPIPLATPMGWVGDHAEAVVHADGDPVATVSRLTEPLSIGQFGRLGDKEVARAEARWLDARDGRHVAPMCVACGCDRDDPAHLGLRPGPVEDSRLFACRWRPSETGPVAPWRIWAALDCPTGFPVLATLPDDQAAATGELAVEIRGEIRAGGDYQLVSRLVDSDGRRHQSEAAVIDERGRAVAVASAIWFTVPLSFLSGPLASGPARATKSRSGATVA